MAPPSTTIDVAIKEMRGIQESDENLYILNVKSFEFRRVEEHLGHIRKKFQDQQNKLPEPFERCLETLKDSVEKAKLLINRSKQRPGLFCCCFGSNTDLADEKMEWKRNFDDICQQLHSLSAVAAEIGVEEPERPPKLKSEQTDRQMAKSAGSPEVKSDHTQQTAVYTGPREPKSDRTRQAAESAPPSELRNDRTGGKSTESARSPEVKSDHSRQIAESARPPELKSDHTRQIVESARPPYVKNDASAWSPEQKNDAFVDSQQIVESIKKDPQKLKDWQF